MKLRPLGTTGVHVSPLCLGAMMFGPMGEPDHDASIKIIHRALDAGINFVDTADAYSGGESEVIVGKALADRRDDVVLATKVHMPMGDDANQRGSSRRWIMRACEDSLRRLGTDRIDLYQVHRPDPATDIDDTMGALSDLVREGKVLYAGCSTFPASMIVESHWNAERRGRVRFRTEQPPYSILLRSPEAEVLPTCQRYGMGVLAWGPLNGGWLSGRWRASTTEMESTRKGLIPVRYDLSVPDNQRKLEVVEALARLAEQMGISLIHLAIAFIIRHPGVSAAIIGPRTMQHLESYLGAADVHLDDDVLDQIDAIVPPGSDVTFLDFPWKPPALTTPALRRR